MKESTLWGYIREGMRGMWDATRIESSSGNGVPDVDFGLPGKHGKIELKYIKEWPVREFTKVKLPLRPEQKLWINQRGKLSGDVWVLIRIENSFFLLKWQQVGSACEGWTKHEWHCRAHECWAEKIDFKQLYLSLRAGTDI